MQPVQNDYFTSVLRQIFDALHEKECCCKKETPCCKEKDHCCNPVEDCCEEVCPEKDCCEKFVPLSGIAVFRVGIPVGADADKHIESYKASIRKTSNTLQRLEAEGIGALFIPVSVEHEDVHIFRSPLRPY